MMRIYDISTLFIIYEAETSAKREYELEQLYLVKKK